MFSLLCTAYTSYGTFFSVRDFFAVYGADTVPTVRTVPAGDVFPRFPSESPLHFADRRDESVIVGYYTSALRPQARFEAQPPQVALSAKMKCISVPRHLPMNLERRDALGKK